MASIVHLDRCNKLAVTVLCKVLNINNCYSLRLHSYSCLPPNLCGEARNIRFGPFNANFASVA